MSMSCQHTPKNQFILFSGFEIFSLREKCAYRKHTNQNFLSIYYGFGRNTAGVNEEGYEFNQILFQSILLKQNGTKNRSESKKETIAENVVIQEGFEEVDEMVNKMKCLQNKKKDSLNYHF